MNTPTPTPQYLVRAGDPLRDRDTVLSIWWGNLGREDRIAAKYDWFYLSGPHGAPLLQLLQETGSGQYVGTACAGRRRLCRGDQALQGGVLVDLAVLPEHRSLGPALMLQQGLIEAADREIDVLYGFPNPKAAPVFKRIGYTHLTDLVRHARVLRHANYLKSRLPGVLAALAGPLIDIAFATRDGLRRLRGPRLHSSWGDSADARMDALWQSAPRGDAVMSVRDCKQAKWRFDDSPLARSRYLWLTATGNDALVAWFAVQVEGTALHVRDFWSQDGGNGISYACLLALLSAARAAGHTSVSVEITGSEAHLHGWQQAGFVPRSKRPIFVRWSRGQEAAKTWFLTSADEDE
ncbi:MAG TPA: hypothetical protein VM469_10025 [Pseudoxanthomonas sp.]|nr:hypothetical protein [Pseudoxanthomonas sp.]